MHPERQMNVESSQINETLLNPYKTAITNPKSVSPECLNILLKVFKRLFVQLQASCKNTLSAYSLSYSSYASLLPKTTLFTRWVTRMKMPTRAIVVTRVVSRKNLQKKNIRVQYPRYLRLLSPNFSLMFSAIPYYSPRLQITHSIFATSDLESTSILKHHGLGSPLPLALVLALSRNTWNSSLEMLLDSSDRLWVNLYLFLLPSSNPVRRRAGLFFVEWWRGRDYLVGEICAEIVVTVLNPLSFVMPRLGRAINSSFKNFLLMESSMTLNFLLMSLFFWRILILS